MASSFERFDEFEKTVRWKNFTDRIYLAATVTVNASDGLGAIPDNAIGLNTAVYDGYMNDAAIPNLLKAAGFTAMR